MHLNNHHPTTHPVERGDGLGLPRLAVQAGRVRFPLQGPHQVHGVDGVPEPAGVLLHLFILKWGKRGDCVGLRW